MLSIIIFGGSRGIGRIIARHFIGKGHKVTIASRNVKTFNTSQLSIARQKTNIHIASADVSNQREVTKAFKSHQKKWGQFPDVVINCAASQGPIGKSWEISVKKWQETVETNLTGAYIVTRTAIRNMTKTGRGSIILFSGGGAAFSRPNFSAYGVSKTGVLRLVETIAEELKLSGYPNIIINAVAPGAVNTEMTAKILKTGIKAGIKELEEAKQVRKTGGTIPGQITNLVDFLIDSEANCGLTGRLIHVREDYRGLVNQFGTSVPTDVGKIRRVPINLEK